MLKKALICMLMLFPVCACAKSEMTLERLLDLNADAMGGKERLENLNSVESRITLTEDGTAMGGHYRANREGQMRVDIYIDGARVFTEALSSRSDGWQQNGEGEAVEGLSEKGMAALQYSIISNLYALHELPALGFKLEYVGHQPMLGKNYHAIDITRPSGIQERQFFDPETFLKAGSMDETALHVDIDPTEKLKVNTDTDYRMVDGIMRAHGGEVIEVEDGKVVQVFELHEIKFNQPVPASDYQGPN